MLILLAFRNDRDEATCFLHLCSYFCHFSSCNLFRWVLLGYYFWWLLFLFFKAENQADDFNIGNAVCRVAVGMIRPSILIKCLAFGLHLLEHIITWLVDLVILAFSHGSPKAIFNVVCFSTVYDWLHSEKLSEMAGP